MTSDIFGNESGFSNEVSATIPDPTPAPEPEPTPAAEPSPVPLEVAAEVPEVVVEVAADGILGANLFQDPDHADPNNPLNAEGEAAGSRRFTRVLNVGADVPLPGIKTVTVLVGWRDSHGQPHVVSQTFQIASLRADDR